MKERCPKCKRCFSGLFVWDGYCHCYPCWADSGYRRVTLEKAGMRAARENRLSLSTVTFLAATGMSLEF